MTHKNNLVQKTHLFGCIPSDMIFPKKYTPHPPPASFVFKVIIVLKSTVEEI